MTYVILIGSVLVIAAAFLTPRIRAVAKFALIALGMFGLYIGVGRLGLLPTPAFLKTQEIAQFSVPTASESDTNTPGVVPAVARTGSEPRAKGLQVPIRFLHYAWNSHMGVILANGGKDTKRGSLMDKYGVKLHLERTDMNDVFMAQALAFATAVKNGQAHPTEGAHFFSMMGDGTAPMLYKLNKRIRAELGPEYQYVIFGSTGRSYGEDKFLGPKEWKADPQKMRGGIVITVPQDGDMNIVLKFAADNGVPVNPDVTTYDPDAINFEAAPNNDYMEAARVFITKPKVTRDEVKNGVKTGRKAVDKPILGVATWTPADQIVVDQLGGVVTLADTRLYSGQMPNAIMGCKKWLADNRETVLAFLAAAYEAGDRIKNPATREAALEEGARYSAVVYNEQTEDPQYWARMFKGEARTDQHGNIVVLGGSRVFNHNDALRLFGLAEGSANTFKATYTTFGQLLAKLYPHDLPEIYPWEEVADASFVTALRGRIGSTAADAPVFREGTQIRSVAGRRTYPINFVFGKAEFADGSDVQLEELRNQLLISENAAVQINGHTDPVGGTDANQALSEARARAVEDYLRQNAPANFSAGRVSSKGFGSTNLLQKRPGESDQAWHARCRRVEVTIGTI